jgi:hypothetical protein
MVAKVVNVDICKVEQLEYLDAYSYVHLSQAQQLIKSYILIGLYLRLGGVAYRVCTAQFVIW